MTVEKLAPYYRSILSECGEDPTRDGLVDTPVRAAKAMQFFTQGNGMTVQDVVGDALFESDNKEMVVVHSIEFYSLCEHHLLPFFGQVHIAYIPNGKVLGLSKFARIVDVFSRRLQIQENLNTHIAQAINDITGAEGVAVSIDAQHMCMMMRGVQKQQAVTSTQTMLGSFAGNYPLQQSFYNKLPRS